MQTLLNELRYSIRMLLRRPSFSVIAILTLALGVGANTAIFSVINAVLFRPLPYPNEDRLVMVQGTKADEPDNGIFNSAVSYLNFTDWQRESRSFEKMAVVQPGEATLTGEGEPARVNHVVVSADIFGVMGVAPMMGRGFTVADELPGNADGLNSIILSYDCWQKRFEADRQILGRKVTLNSQLYSVIGVLPAGIFPLQQEPVDFWMTTASNGDPAKPGTANGSRGYPAYAAVLARLKPDVTVMQAQAEMESITRALREKYPEANALRGAKVTSLRSLLTDGAKPLLLLLLGIVGAVLLIACANVANLLLARSTVRQREVAIRAVLGAGRWQVMRSLLMESILLAVMGGALGLLISLWGVDLLTALMPVDVPRITGLQPDWRVLLFTLAASVLTGVLCGIAPAWSASNINLTEAMKEGGRHSTSGRSQNLFRDVLVVGQIAIALTLLTGAGLLLRSFIHLQQVNPGFDSRNLLTATVVLSSDRYEKPEHILNFFRELQSRLRTLPGVTAVTLAQSIPLTSRDNGTRMEIEGKPFPKGQQPDARLRFISPDYFRTIGIQQLAGRDFSQRDTQDAPPVVIINEAFVQQYFPGESPLGKKLILGWGGDEPKEIVGVFSNVRHRGLDDQPRPEMYVPHAQFPVPDMTLMLRTSVKPESLTPALTAKVRELDAQLPVTDVRTLDEYRHDSVALPRFSTFVLLTFASLALLLSVIGLYGVISYSVTRRVSEFGVRMALGAQPRDILTMVLRQGMKRVIIGVALGVAASMGLSRLLTKLLYGISPNDPITIIGVVALLLLTAFAACLLPARRATKVDPITALRCE